MDTTLKLTGGYCSIPDLYNHIAAALNLPIDDKIKYDCTKIEVSQQIQDEVFSYYKKENIDPATIGMWWVCYGPKVSDKLKVTEVLVYDGWYEPEP